MEAIYFIGNLTFPYDLWLNHKNLTAFRPKSNSRQIFSLQGIWNLPNTPPKTRTLTNRVGAGCTANYTKGANKGD